MEDHTENSVSRDEHDGEQSEQDSARLHRLVLPMILDMLRSRGRDGFPGADDPDDVHTSSEETPLLSPSSTALNPDARERDTGADAHEMVHADTVGAERESSEESFNSDLAYLFDDTAPSQPTNQQGQRLPSRTHSPTSSQLSSSPSRRSRPSSSSGRRPRYRLVVYFEEREAPAEDTASAESSVSDNDVPPLIHSTRPASRYVAVFSIDSDPHNMPIIHSAGLHNTPASFDDILNHLFNTYVPKGTPPAKGEIIDTLPTSVYSNCHSGQPKCAVCLEDFVEGAEMVELPCTHRFHGEACIKPWLRLHSSCPVCRYEMPVDDVEYEEQRIKRMSGRANIPTENSALDDPMEVDSTDDFSLL